jgi:hypothetical protein
MGAQLQPCTIRSYGERPPLARRIESIREVPYAGSVARTRQAAAIRTIELHHRLQWLCGPERKSEFSGNTRKEQRCKLSTQN